MLNLLLNHSPLLYFTQSFWRDEAYSVLAAQHSLVFILKNITLEPPVYYILLHLWMKFFGTGEIATRSLSLLGLTLATMVVIFWAEKLFKHNFLSWFLPLFFFLNPMLLYYGFEVRTYGWYIFFTVLSVYAYLENRWTLYIISSLLGFYTHSYFLFILVTQVLHWTYLHRNNLYCQLQQLRTNKTLLSFTAIALGSTPWLLRVALESFKLGYSWYYPVDLHLIKSVLGNMFLGYEGTPWYLWPYTAMLSIFLIIIFLVSLLSKKHSRYVTFFLMLVFIPLIIVIGISFIKPLFVNRYLIPVTVGEIFLIIFSIASLPKTFQHLSALLSIVSIFLFNVWYPSQHTKVNIRAPLIEINKLKQENDVVLAESPLVFFETLYYSNDKNHVYLYNPSGNAFPWYVGSSIVSTSQIRYKLPSYPTKAFLIHENGTYNIIVDLPFGKTIKQESSPAL